MTGTPINFTGNRLSYNVYGYTSDRLAPGAILEANNFLNTTGSGSESVPSAAVLSEGDGDIVKHNRFEKNLMNISGTGNVQESNNFGIDVLF